MFSFSPRAHSSIAQAFSLVSHFCLYWWRTVRLVSVPCSVVSHLHCNRESNLPYDFMCYNRTNNSNNKKKFYIHRESLFLLFFLSLSLFFVYSISIHKYLQMWLKHYSWRKTAFQKTYTLSRQNISRSRNNKSKIKEDTKTFACRDKAIPYSV